MTVSKQLEERLRAILFNGPAARRLFQLRQRRPELAYELDQIAVALKDAGDEVLQCVRALELPIENDAA
jgi:DNA-binding TFAR19-related protein (PDSD5 family)